MSRLVRFIPSEGRESKRNFTFTLKNKTTKSTPRSETLVYFVVSLLHFCILYIVFALKILYQAQTQRNPPKSMPGLLTVLFHALEKDLQLVYL